jgi:hypothetical protein
MAGIAVAIFHRRLLFQLNGYLNLAAKVERTLRPMCFGNLQFLHTHVSPSSGGAL